MALEIERKFLVKDDSFKMQAVKTIFITQGYMTSMGNCIMRVRIADKKAVITIKSKRKNSSFIRYEWEYPIPLKDAREMMKTCVSNIICKTRYFIPVGKHLFEVDVFHGENEGLVIAEVELAAENESFEHPDWLGDEVTKKECYYNAFIAHNPYKKWEAAMKKNCVST